MADDNTNLHPSNGGISCIKYFRVFAEFFIDHAAQTGDALPRRPLSEIWDALIRLKASAEAEYQSQHSGGQEQTQQNEDQIQAAQGALPATDIEIPLSRSRRRKIAKAARRAAEEQEVARQDEEPDMERREERSKQAAKKQEEAKQDEDPEMERWREHEQAEQLKLGSWRDGVDATLEAILKTLMAENLTKVELAIHVRDMLNNLRANTQYQPHEGFATIGVIMRQGPPDQSDEDEGRRPPPALRAIAQQPAATRLCPVPARPTPHSQLPLALRITGRQPAAPALRPVVQAEAVPRAHPLPARPPSPPPLRTQPHPRTLHGRKLGATGKPLTWAQFAAHGGIGDKNLTYTMLKTLNPQIPPARLPKDRTEKKVEKRRRRR